MRGRGLAVPGVPAPAEARSRDRSTRILTAPGSRTIALTAPRGARRLDALLVEIVAELAPELTRSRLAALARAGRVLVEGRVAKPSRPIVAGERIEIEIPEAEPLEAQAEDIPLTIVFEDEHLVVVDKPAGMVVHPGAGNPTGTLVNALLSHCRDLSGIGGSLRPGIVHRLDKDTSGLVVVAKNDVAHQALASAFARRDVRKVYAAIVYGTPKPAAGVIERAIRRHPTDRLRMTTTAGAGRAALTRYETVASFGGLTHVTCYPKTGRTHQIRVHLVSIGHPVVGDTLYAGAQWNGLRDPHLRKAAREFPRQALHAAELEFPHPLTGERLTFRARLPADFAGLAGAISAGSH